MGMEIVRLGESDVRQLSGEKEELGELSFVTHNLPEKNLSIWMMTATRGQQLVPWWNYDAKIDGDLQRLNDFWGVSSAQGFFDCLYLSQFKKMASNNFYVIAPGYLRTDGWDKMPEASRVAYLRGQGCVYRLEGAFDSKLTINWVPFAQPQSLVKDPSFGALWPMFTAARNDDVANSLGFFSLSDIHQLPKVVGMLISQSNNRSLELASAVDWFGLYSSPITPDHTACSVVYTKHVSVMAKLAEFQQKFQHVLNEARATLKANPAPQTAFKVLSRYIAI